ncbi:MAG TPA: hypothetical protein VGQ04_08965 [Chitinophagaceae bacterium]|jgi:hypothetical protein|nr:hypothetical protein [Chitinophagaceae bacterium]
MIKFPLLAILLFVGAFLFGQTRSEKEIKDLLAHKWKATHMEQGGQKMPIPTEAGDSFLDIKADGTLIEISSEGQKKSKWSYDHRTKTFTVSNEVDPLDPWKFELIKVSETELVIKATEDGMTMNMYLKRVN